MRTLVVVLAAVLASPIASAQEPPRRQIPAPVLAELAILENRFDLAVSADCHAERCFSRGCTYVAHALADRPQAASMPGLDGDPGPGSVEAQAWLTQATCSFAHESSLESADVQALVRRLQAKVSTGWTRVSVEHVPLPPLPPALLAPPETLETEAEPPAEPPPPPEPEPLTLGQAGRDLWASLLDNVDWIAALLLGTAAVVTVIWAWRRVGRESVDDRELLELSDNGDEPVDAAPDASADDRAFVAAQSAAWRLRLQGVDADRPDGELGTMIGDLLRAGELPLLAKAVLTFPELPKAFPSGGDSASAKLELADYLKTVDVAALPSDAELFRALNRHALAAALASQRDADIVRSLREEFGATGLATLIQSVPPRIGALLFALAPGEGQREIVRLLSPSSRVAVATQLLRSNRMDPHETSYLFGLLEAARRGSALPAPPVSDELSDHGAVYDATGALSVLLPNVAATERAALFATLLRRFGGSLPAWYGGILVPEMLFGLSGEALADLLLAVDVELLAAWVSMLDPEPAARLQERMPASLRESVRAASTFASRARQVAAADRGRRELSRALQAHLARARVPFDQVLGALADAA